MSVIRLLHTAVLVTDLERAEQFYTQVLGLIPVERPLKYPGTWYQLGDIQIHLIVSERVEPTPGGPTKLGRNPHLALAVADLEAVQQALEQQQWPFQRSASGRPAIFIQDPDGNVIELCQAA